MGYKVDSHFTVSKNSIPMNLLDLLLYPRKRTCSQNKLKRFQARPEHLLEGSSGLSIEKGSALCYSL